MILVTTGTQEPFDRLIKAIDEMAPRLNGQQIIAQCTTSQYKVKNIELTGMLPPKEFDTLMDQADLIVGHAGMGTIISALVRRKPLLVMPRLLRLKEHRNDHQMATAKKMAAMGYVEVAFDEKELVQQLPLVLKNTAVKNIDIETLAAPELIGSLREFILRGK
ncbi:glycosyltransferase [Niabella sp.]|uniref:glycosyltransferase n=1 Tax=Niabella sp. TaxID=1962976 RepID=UPI002622A248|nr:glycosyltransferase [Niabella sp.]